MPSNFDLLESAMMDVVTNQFGYTATWTPSVGGEMKTAKVLFSDPTKKQQVQSIDFSGDTYAYIEYKKSDFPGLLEATRNTHTKETVVVDGTPFYCRFTRKKYDGDTIIITLDPADE